MDISLKQRLVGAAVIIAVAVIVIPLLLDGSGERVISEIPPRPVSIATDPYRLAEEMPPLSVRPASRPLESPPPADSETDVQEAEGAPIAAAPDTSTGAETSTTAPLQERASAVQDEKPSGSSEPAADAESVAGELQAWVVQVGSFSEQEKARALREELLSKGFGKAYVERHNAGKRVMYRVRIGPEMERSRAEQMLSQLQGKTGYKGYVASHP